MNRKTKYITAAFLLILALAGIRAVKNDFGLGRNMEIMISFMRQISTSYVDEVKADDMMLSGAEGITSRLDPYTTYLAEEEMSNFEVLTTGKYGGIGALIRQDSVYVKIAEPYRNSPADKAGLKIGDLIVAIDGENAKGFSTQDVSSRLKGEPGTTVKVGIKKVASGDIETVKIKRERIIIPSVSYVGYVADGIGYIRHADFTDTCYDDVRQAIKSLSSEGKLDKLILDYRNNGGGVMQSAVKILSLFLPKGTHVLSTKGRNGSQTDYATEYDPLLPDIPLVILINSHSASAAEIVAGSLQDLDRAVLVGQKSFGKGLVQTTYPLGYNAYAKITTAKYYIPTGRCIQAIRYSSDGTTAQVPDSLITEFKTKNGRKVYDGGGIMPDRITKVDYVSPFAASLYLTGVVDDFGDLYFRNHPNGISAARDFSIDTDDYSDFKKMVEGREIAFKSESRRQIERLRSTLKKEGFDQSVEDVDRIAAQLRDDKSSMLEKYKEELREAINSNIVIRYAYASGAIENSLDSDKDISEAIKVLNSETDYKSILKSQDTKRK